MAPVTSPSSSPTSSASLSPSTPSSLPVPGPIPASTSILIASTVPLFSFVPLTSTTAPTASCPFSWSNFVDASVCTALPAMVQLPINPPAGIAWTTPLISTLFVVAALPSSSSDEPPLAWAPITKSAVRTHNAAGATYRWICRLIENLLDWLGSGPHGANRLASVLQALFQRHKQYSVGKYS